MVNQNPTAAELEILNVLWENGSATVRFVHEQLSEIKTVTYTTTLKIMQNMHDKGFLTRETEGRGHIYYPSIEREKTRSNLLERFLENTFAGSASDMVMQLLGNHKTSEAELKKIKNLLNDIEKK
jgi:predicted transcriptional regulator